MKPSARWISVAVVICAICPLATYQFAYHRGYERGYNNGTADTIGRCRLFESVAFLAALQQLRAGDTPRATRMMEQSCFDSAHIFYKNPALSGEVSQWGHAQGLTAYPDTATTKEIAQELSKYRSAYRTNSADWDDMERKLDVELAKIK